MSLVNIRLTSVRKWGKTLTFGLIEQSLLSGTSLFITILLARGLGAAEFGAYSVIWACVFFFELTLNGLFGDGIPSIAHQLEPRDWPKFRACLLGATVVLCCLIACIVSLAASFDVLGVSDYKSAMIVASIYFVVQRIQNVVRRTLYIDNLRGRAALGAVVNTTVTLAAFLAISHLHHLSVASGFICMIFGSFGWIIVNSGYLKQYEMPSWSDFTWVVSRVWKTGRWTMITAAMSWSANTGVIPLAAFLLSPVESGALRALQTMVLPLVQVNQILISMMVPKVAGEVKTASATRLRSLAIRGISILGVVGFSYAAVISVAGPSLFNMAFSFGDNIVTSLAITITVFGYALEAARYGCNIVFYASADTVTPARGQLLSLLAAIFLIPLLGHYLGLTGIVLGMTVANNLNTIFIVLVFFRKNRER